MSIDAKANTLPKWSYILLAALLVPFGVGSYLGHSFRRTMFRMR